MKFLFNHQNFNVLDLEKSIAFYEEALGLTVNRTYKASYRHTNGFDNIDGANNMPGKWQRLKPSESLLE